MAFYNWNLTDEKSFESWRFHRSAYELTALQRVRFKSYDTDNYWMTWKGKVNRRFFKKMSLQVI